MSEKPAGRGLTVPKNPAAMLRALNTKHSEETDTDSNNLTNKETDQQTNNTTILQTDMQPVGQDSPPPTIGSTPAPAPPEETVPVKQTSNPTSKQSNKPTKKQTNNTTKVEPPLAPSRRDGRTLRSRQPASDPTATIVTSFRISVGTMEALDRYCFENRLRKQDVVEQALAAYMAEDEE